MVFDLIIIGAGPAGMTAGVYAARKKLKTLIITQDIGGQAAWSSDIENYLGFTMITGADLVAKFEQHLEVFKDEVTLKLSQQPVASITRDGKHFVVTYGDEHASGKAVIIAGGKVPRKLGVKGEAEFLNRGVTYCAWCDGPIFAGKDVAIIGGGNAALDAALNISKIVRNIYIVNITEQLTGDPVMIDKVREHHNIRIMNNTEVVSIDGKKFVDHIVIKDHDKGLEKPLEVAGVFIEVGSLPATDYLKGIVKLNETGEIVIDKNNMTSEPGIFAAGDITDVVEKQIIVATGEGAKAAICASQYLSKH